MAHFPSSQEPSSSQMSQPGTGNPSLFVDAAGNHLAVFVDANGVRNNRPQLIRQLKQNGAVVCHNPGSARIILVDPATKEGRQFVRDWGADSGKVVLSIAWIHDCIAAGRSLLENDDWAGCGDLDGSPLSDDDDEDDEPGGSDEDEAERSLPTPRETPNGRAKATASPRGRATSRQNSGTLSRKPKLPTPPPTAQSTSESHSPRVPSGSSTGQTQQPAPLPSSQTGATSFPQSQPQQRPVLNVDPNMQVAVRSPFGGPLSPQQMNEMMQNPSFMSAVLSMANALSAPAQTWPGQSPAAAAQYMQTLQMMQFQSQFQQNQAAQLAALNVNYGAGPSNTSHEPHSTPSQVPEPYISQDVHAELPHSPSQTHSKRKGSLADSSRVSFSPSSPSRGAGTKRARSPSFSNKRPYKRPSSSSSSTESPLSSSKPIPPSPSRSDSVTGIFMTLNGAPMSFYVHTEVRDRREIAQLIKKQGGRLSDDMSTSRFVVLTTRSKQFDKLKKEAVIHHKKRPLKPAFIRACIDAQRIVNESDYRFEDEIADPKPRGRPRKSERKSSNSSPRTGRKPKAAFAPGAAYDDPRLRSPTPPTKVVVMTPGKNAFSPEERRYVINFARCAFRRDPLLSYTALASMLGARVLSHSTGSWSNYLSQRKEEIDRLRKEVHKESKSAEDGAEDVDMADEEIDVESMDEEDINKTGDEPSEEDVNSDLLDITSYFASEPKGSDQDLWDGLDSKHTCRTAGSWQEFYELRKEQVDELLKQALNKDQELVTVPEVVTVG